MEGTIYLVGIDGKWQEMRQEAYPSEEMLQKHLADFPNLLAGDQVDPENPRRWLLVSREMAVPEEEAGAGRWSLDHLFLDQDGIPTLVELKRATDTRSRREVVAQMLDYAANAAVYWTVESVRAKFESNCQRNNIDAVEAVRNFLQLEEEPAYEDQSPVKDYWEKVEDNLRLEKIRLVFMADRIQPELRRIVEFLNGQMAPAEVLAIEVPLFVGSNQKAFVPRVVGLTAKAEKAKEKRPRESRVWDEGTFFEEIKRLNPKVFETARAIYDWAINKGLSIRWQGGPVAGSFGVIVKQKDDEIQLLSLGTAPYYKEGARINLSIYRIRLVPPFTERANMIKLLEDLNQIPGIKIDESVIDDEKPRYPGISPYSLAEPDAIKKFLATFDWVVEQVQSS